eukprot:gene11071-biopygen8081
MCLRPSVRHTQVDLCLRPSERHTQVNLCLRPSAAQPRAGVLFTKAGDPQAHRRARAPQRLAKGSPRAGRGSPRLARGSPGQARQRLAKARQSLGTQSPGRARPRGGVSGLLKRRAHHQRRVRLPYQHVKPFPGYNGKKRQGALGQINSRQKRGRFFRVTLRFSRVTEEKRSRALSANQLKTESWTCFPGYAPFFPGYRGKNGAGPGQPVLFSGLQRENGTGPGKRVLGKRFHVARPQRRRVVHPRPRVFSPLAAAPRAAGGGQLREERHVAGGLRAAALSDALPPAQRRVGGGGGGAEDVVHQAAAVVAVLPARLVHVPVRRRLPPPAHRHREAVPVPGLQAQIDFYLRIR